MSDEAKPLTFTLADHDLLVKCVGGIEQILEKLAAVSKRQDIIESRMKVVEDWKIKVMAIVLCIGIFLGWICSNALPALLPLVTPSHAQTIPPVVPVPAPTAHR